MATLFTTVLTARHLCEPHLPAAVALAVELLPVLPEPVALQDLRQIQQAAALDLSKGLDPPSSLVK